MKLYATVTSERATKGQGGNEYINIDLMRGSASDSIKCYRLHFTEKALSILKNDKVIFQELVEKGEKQKGENLVSCESCGSQYEYYTEPKEVKEGGEHICSDCWNNPE